MRHTSRDRKNRHKLQKIGKKLRQEAKQKRRAARKK